MCYYYNRSESYGKIIESLKLSERVSGQMLLLLSKTERITELIFINTYIYALHYAASLQESNMLSAVPLFTFWGITQSHLRKYCIIQQSFIRLYKKPSKT